jgi:hypothetical protein
MKAVSPPNKEWKDLTIDERRERRQLRREKQRADNLSRSAKMHLARLKKLKNDAPKVSVEPKASDAPGGAIGNGETHSMPGCDSRRGLNVI